MSRRGPATNLRPGGYHMQPGDRPRSKLWELDDSPVEVTEELASAQAAVAEAYVALEAAWPEVRKRSGVRCDFERACQEYNKILEKSKE